MKILTNTRAVLSGLAVAGIATAGIALGAAPAQAAPTSVWDRVAACESGGNWHISTGNGFYGGLQFTLSTWHGYGGAGNPADASRSQQIAIAERVLAGQGWGAWPVCSIKAGATGSSSTARSYSAGTTRSYHSSASSNETHVSQNRAPVRAPRHVAVSRHAAAPVGPTRPASVKTSGKTYTVESGDSLSKVAKKFDIKAGWRRLWAANPKVGNPDLIVVGQKLQLPAA